MDGITLPSVPKLDVSDPGATQRKERIWQPSVDFVTPEPVSAEPVSETPTVAGNKLRRGFSQQTMDALGKRPMAELTRYVPDMDPASRPGAISEAMETGFFHHYTPETAEALKHLETMMERDPERQGEIEAILGSVRNRDDIWPEVAGFVGATLPFDAMDLQVERQQRMPTIGIIEKMNPFRVAEAVAVSTGEGFTTTTGDIALGLASLSGASDTAPVRALGERRKWMQQDIDSSERKREIVERGWNDPLVYIADNVGHQVGLMGAVTATSLVAGAGAKLGGLVRVGKTGQAVVSGGAAFLSMAGVEAKAFDDEADYYGLNPEYRTWTRLGASLTNATLEFGTRWLVFGKEFLGIGGARDTVKTSAGAMKKAAVRETVEHLVRFMPEGARARTLKYLGGMAAEGTEEVEQNFFRKLALIQGLKMQLGSYDAALDHMQKVDGADTKGQMFLDWAKESAAEFGWAALTTGIINAGPYALTYRTEQEKAVVLGGLGVTVDEIKELKAHLDNENWDAFAYSTTLFRAERQNVIERYAKDLESVDEPDGIQNLITKFKNGDTSQFFATEVWEGQKEEDREMFFDILDQLAGHIREGQTAETADTETQVESGTALTSAMRKETYRYAVAELIARIPNGTFGAFAEDLRKDGIARGKEIADLKAIVDKDAPMLGAMSDASSRPEDIVTEVLRASVATKYDEGQRKRMAGRAFALSAVIEAALERERGMGPYGEAVEAESQKAEQGTKGQWARARQELKSRKAMLDALQSDAHRRILIEAAVPLDVIYVELKERLNLTPDSTVDQITEVRPAQMMAFLLGEENGQQDMADLFARSLYGLMIRYGSVITETQTVRQLTAEELAALPYDEVIAALPEYGFSAHEMEIIRTAISELANNLVAKSEEMADEAAERREKAKAAIKAEPMGEVSETDAGKALDAVEIKEPAADAEELAEKAGLGEKESRRDKDSRKQQRDMGLDSVENPRLTFAQALSGIEDAELTPGTIGRGVLRLMMRSLLNDALVLDTDIVDEKESYRTAPVECLTAFLLDNGVDVKGLDEEGVRKQVKTLLDKATIRDDLSRLATGRAWQAVLKEEARLRAELQANPDSAEANASLGLVLKQKRELIDAFHDMWNRAFLNFYAMWRNNLAEIRTVRASEGAGVDAAAEAMAESADPGKFWWQQYRELADLPKKDREPKLRKYGRYALWMSLESGLLERQQAAARRALVRSFDVLSNVYEVSTKGDSRFSALVARLKDGRTIEEAYQLDVKGYRVKSNDWHVGKRQPPLNGKTHKQVRKEYKALWEQWLNENPDLEKDLLTQSVGKPLHDQFATRYDINQADTLAELLKKRHGRPNLQSLAKDLSFMEAIMQASVTQVRNAMASGRGQAVPVELAEPVRNGMVRTLKAIMVQPVGLPYREARLARYKAECLEAGLPEAEFVAMLGAAEKHANEIRKGLSAAEYWIAETIRSQGGLLATNPIEDVEKATVRPGHKAKSLPPHRAGALPNWYLAMVVSDMLQSAEPRGSDKQMGILDKVMSTLLSKSLQTRRSAVKAITRNGYTTYRYEIPAFDVLPMTIRYSKEESSTGEDTSAFDLVTSGMKTATTRHFREAPPKVGAVLRFKSDDDKTTLVRVTEVLNVGKRRQMVGNDEQFFNEMAMPDGLTPKAWRALYERKGSPIDDNAFQVRFEVVDQKLQNLMWEGATHFEIRQWNGATNSDGSMRPGDFMGMSVVVDGKTPWYWQDTKDTVEQGERKAMQEDVALGAVWQKGGPRAVGLRKIEDPNWMRYQVELVCGTNPKKTTHKLFPEAHWFKAVSDVLNEAVTYYDQFLPHYVAPAMEEALSAGYGLSFVSGKLAAPNTDATIAKARREALAKILATRGGKKGLHRVTEAFEMRERVIRQAKVSVKDAQRAWETYTRALRSLVADELVTPEDGKGMLEDANRILRFINLDVRPNWVVPGHEALLEIMTSLERSGKAAARMTPETLDKVGGTVKAYWDESVSSLRTIFKQLDDMSPFLSWKGRQQLQVLRDRGSRLDLVLPKPSAATPAEITPAASTVAAPVAPVAGGVTLHGKSPYRAKDQAKADRATKFIGRGSENSSTRQYAVDFGNKANTGQYTAQDSVFVSVEGQRQGRVSFNARELQKAMDAGATIITDRLGEPGENGTRSGRHNEGEREVAKYLESHGYQEDAGRTGTWTPVERASVPKVTVPTVEQEALRVAIRDDFSRPSVPETSREGVPVVSPQDADAVSAVEDEEDGSSMTKVHALDRGYGMGFALSEAFEDVTGPVDESDIARGFREVLAAARRDYWPESGATRVDLPPRLDGFLEKDAEHRERVRAHLQGVRETARTWVAGVDQEHAEMLGDVLAGVYGDMLATIGIGYGWTPEQMSKALDSVPALVTLVDYEQVRATRAREQQTRAATADRLRAQAAAGDTAAAESLAVLESRMREESAAMGDVEALTGVPSGANWFAIGLNWQSAATADERIAVFVHECGHILARMEPLLRMTAEGRKLMDAAKKAAKEVTGTASKDASSEAKANLLPMLYVMSKSDDWRNTVVGRAVVTAHRRVVQQVRAMSAGARAVDPGTRTKYGLTPLSSPDDVLAVVEAGLPGTMDREAVANAMGQMLVNAVAQDLPVNVRTLGLAQGPGVAEAKAKVKGWQRVGDIAVSGVGGWASVIDVMAASGADVAEFADRFFSRASEGPALRQQVMELEARVGTEKLGKAQIDKALDDIVTGAAALDKGPVTDIQVQDVADTIGSVADAFAARSDTNQNVNANVTSAPSVPVTLESVLAEYDAALGETPVVPVAKQRTVKELREAAKELGLTGVGKLRKADLLAAVEAKEAEARKTAASAPAPVVTIEPTSTPVPAATEPSAPASVPPAPVSGGYSLNLDLEAVDEMNWEVALDDAVPAGQPPPVPPPSAPATGPARVSTRLPDASLEVAISALSSGMTIGERARSRAGEKPGQQRQSWYAQKHVKCCELLAEYCATKAEKHGGVLNRIMSSFGYWFSYLGKSYIGWDAPHITDLRFALRAIQRAPQQAPVLARNLVDRVEGDVWTKTGQRITKTDELLVGLLFNERQMVERVRKGHTLGVWVPGTMYGIQDAETDTVAYPVLDFLNDLITQKRNDLNAKGDDYVMSTKGQWLAARLEKLERYRDDRGTLSQFQTRSVDSSKQFLAFLEAFRNLYPNVKELEAKAFAMFQVARHLSLKMKITLDPEEMFYSHFMYGEMLEYDEQASRTFSNVMLKRLAVTKGQPTDSAARELTNMFTMQFKQEGETEEGWLKRARKWLHSQVSPMEARAEMLTDRTIYHPRLGSTLHPGIDMRENMVRYMTRFLTNYLAVQATMDFVHTWGVTSEEKALMEQHSGATQADPRSHGGVRVAPGALTHGYEAMDVTALFSAFAGNNTVMLNEEQVVLMRSVLADPRFLEAMQGNDIEAISASVRNILSEDEYKRLSSTKDFFPEIISAVLFGHPGKVSQEQLPQIKVALDQLIGNMTEAREALFGNPEQAGMRDKYLAKFSEVLGRSNNDPEWQAALSGIITGKASEAVIEQLKGEVFGDLLSTFDIHAVDSGDWWLPAEIVQRFRQMTEKHEENAFARVTRQINSFVCGCILFANQVKMLFTQIVGDGTAMVPAMWSKLPEYIKEQYVQRAGVDVRNFTLTGRMRMEMAQAMATNHISEGMVGDLMSDRDSVTKVVSGGMRAAMAEFQAMRVASEATTDAEERALLTGRMKKLESRIRTMAHQVRFSNYVGRLFRHDSQDDLMFKQLVGDQADKADGFWSTVLGLNSRYSDLAFGKGNVTAWRNLGVFHPIQLQKSINSAREVIQRLSVAYFVHDQIMKKNIIDTDLVGGARLKTVVELLDQNLIGYTQVGKTLKLDPTQLNRVPSEIPWRLACLVSAETFGDYNDRGPGDVLIRTGLQPFWMYMHVDLRRVANMYQNYGFEQKLFGDAPKAEAEIKTRSQAIMEVGRLHMRAARKLLWRTSACWLMVQAFRASAGAMLNTLRHWMDDDDDDDRLVADQTFMKSFLEVGYRAAWMPMLRWGNKEIVFEAKTQHQELLERGGIDNLLEIGKMIIGRDLPPRLQSEAMAKMLVGEMVKGMGQWSARMLGPLQRMALHGIQSVGAATEEDRYRARRAMERDLGGQMWGGYLGRIVRLTLDATSDVVKGMPLGAGEMGWRTGEIAAKVVNARLRDRLREMAFEFKYETLRPRAYQVNADSEDVWQHKRALLDALYYGDANRATEAFARYKEAWARDDETDDEILFNILQWQSPMHAWRNSAEAQTVENRRSDLDHVERWEEWCRKLKIGGTHHQRLQAAYIYYSRLVRNAEEIFELGLERDLKPIATLVDEASGRKYRFVAF